MNEEGIEQLNVYSIFFYYYYSRMWNPYSTFTVRNETLTVGLRYLLDKLIFQLVCM